MGLDCTFDAFHGAYSAFNSLRQEVCRATGGSYPPHWKRGEDGELLRDPEGYLVYDREFDENSWYWGDGYSQDSHPGLWEFLTHSDCDGEISPAMCVTVADELEAILDRIPEGGNGHIAARGGYREVLRKFIQGCRAAHAAGKPLEFC